MAAPNLVNVKKIYLKSTAIILVGASGAPTTLLTNAASSGKVYKINSIRGINFDAAIAYDGTVRLNKNAGGAGVFGYHTVPAKSVVKFLGKDETLYLEENDTLDAFGSTTNKLNFIISYEDITDVP